MARATVQTRVIDRGFAAEIAHARALNGRGVKMGVQASAGQQNGVDLLDILIWNEYGTRNIPARPVMRSYFDQNARTIGAESDNAATFVLRTGRVDLALGRMGEYMQSGLQAHWLNSKAWAVPNAPATIAMKGSDVPLIDNSLLIRATRYQVI